MTLTNTKAGHEINVVQGEQVERRGESGRVASEKRPAKPAKATAVRGVLERRWRRKRDINSLDGLMREHARLIAAMHNNRVDLAKAEVISRAYGRHREMVTALEQREQIAALQRQLEDLKASGHATLAYVPEGEPGAVLPADRLIGDGGAP